MNKKLIIMLSLAVIIAMAITAFPLHIEPSHNSDWPFVITIGSPVSAQEADYTCDGAADDEQFQAALNALPSAGGQLFVLAGNYTFADSTTVTRAIDHVSIIGVSAAVSFEGDGTTAIFTAGGDGWLISNIEVDAGGLAMGATTDYMWLHVIADSTYYPLKTDTINIENHSALHGVGGADTIFPADPGADKYLMWDDDPGQLSWEDGGGIGDMAKATYDTDEDGDIDTAAGGTEWDSSGATGVAYITAGAWGTRSTGISNTYILIVDDADAANGDIPYFTTTGLAGYDEAEFKSAYNMEAGTDYQAQDAELQAIAGLTSAANKMIYFTGAGTAATADLTAFARSILDDTDEATFKATVNLEIGTDVQAQDAELSALAGLTSAADKLPYFTGSGTADVTGLSAFTRGFLDDADEATFKATVNLEIGTDVLAYDATLSSIAALGTGADKIAYTTGVDTWAETGLTAFARSILDDVDEATFKATVNLELGDIIGGLQSNETVTVGGGGDYATINAALTYLSKKYPLYIANGYTADIQLLAGFEAAEQVFVRGIDLGWITITSAEPEKSITAFADGGAGYTVVTINGHGYSDSDVVRIWGTTNYNGAWDVSSSDANTFEINTDYVADDGTGTCKRGTNIDRSALDEVFYTYELVDGSTADRGYPFLGACDNGVLPVIDVLFGMDSSGTGTSRDGCQIIMDSRAYWKTGSGVLNAGRHGIYVTWDSTVAGLATFWNGAANTGIYLVGGCSAYFGHAVARECDTGMNIDSASMCDALKVTLDDNTTYGLRCTGNSRVQCLRDASTGSISGNGINIECSNGSVVHARDMLCNDATTYAVYCHAGAVINILDGYLNDPGTASAYCREGGLINLKGATYNGSFTLLSNGEIIDTDGNLITGKDQALKLTNDGILTLSKQSAGRAYQNANNQNIASGDWIRVLLTAEDFDLQSEFDIYSLTDQAEAGTDTDTLVCAGVLGSVVVGDWIWNQNDDTYHIVTDISGAPNSVEYSDVDAGELANGDDFILYRSTFTVTEPGIYLITGNVYYASPVADKYVSIGIFKNDSNTFLTRYHTSSTAVFCPSICTTLSLTTDDKITLRTHHNCGAAEELTANSQTVTLSITKVA